MKIIIKSIDFKAGKNLEIFVREKVKKLFRQCDNLIRANVILRKEAVKILKINFAKYDRRCGAMIIM